MQMKYRSPYRVVDRETNALSPLSPADMQRYECAMSWRAHDGEVYSVEFSYDENTVISIGEDGKVRPAYGLEQGGTKVTRAPSRFRGRTLQLVTFRLFLGGGLRLETLCAFFVPVCSVEHPSMRGEAVGSLPASGRHGALRPVGVQRVQAGAGAPRTPVRLRLRGPARPHLLQQRGDHPQGNHPHPSTLLLPAFRCRSGG